MARKTKTKKEALEPELVTAAAIVEPVVEPLPKVAFRVFATVHSKQWDQLAGFAAYARQQKLGPRSIPAWEQAYQEFLEKPVR